MVPRGVVHTLSLRNAPISAKSKIRSDLQFTWILSGGISDFNRLNLKCPLCQPSNYEVNGSYSIMCRVNPIFSDVIFRFMKFGVLIPMI